MWSRSWPTWPAAIPSWATPPRHWPTSSRPRRSSRGRPQSGRWKSILLSRTGQEAQALALARQAIADNIYDYDLANATFVLAWRAGDYDLAVRAMRVRMVGWPASRAEGYFQLGTMYDTGLQDTEQALAAFTQALALAPDSERPDPGVAHSARVPGAAGAWQGRPGGTGRASDVGQQGVGRRLAP